MKKLYTTFVALLAITQFSYAQWTGVSNGIHYSSGNVGIGTGNTNPGYPLTLNSAGETGILTTSNGTNIYLSHGGWGMGAGRLGIGNGTTPTLTVNSVINGGTSVGNVGIGTTSPLFRLNLSQDITMNADVDVAQFGISGSSDPAKRLVMGYDVNGAGFGFIKAGWYQHQWTDLALQPNGGNVGIGTTTPGSKLEVAGDIAIKTNNPVLLMRNNAGTADTKISDIWATGATINFRLANDTYSASNNYMQVIRSGYVPTVISFPNGNVGIGTTDPKGYKLAVNGSAVATSMTVKLNGNWPDYVFKPYYTLPSLNEVKAYIDKNQRLPEMPSDKDVEKNGINLGDIVKLQTKKIEELTLYLIQKDEQLKVQQDEILLLKDQRKEIDELKAQMAKLLK